MPTVVFALLLGAAAAAALVREITGRTLDLEAAAPWTLLAAGGLLVVWAFVGLVRQQSRRDTDPVTDDAADERDPVPVRSEPQPRSPRAVKVEDPVSLGRRIFHLCLHVSFPGPPQTVTALD